MSDSVVQTSAGTISATLAPTPPWTAVAPPMLHKEGYFTATYLIVVVGLLLYVVTILRRFPRGGMGGAFTPRS